MPSDLIRGWKPVRVKKTRQIKNLESRFDSIEIESERALEYFPRRTTNIEPQGRAEMPVKIFYAQGNKNIGGLEAEINKWQESLGPRASVTHTSTAMAEHRDDVNGGETRVIVTIWFEL